MPAKIPSGTCLLNAFFVYGTLKRGEINHPLLEPYACSIESGWITGLLYDVGDFPALAEGDGRVYGEIIHLDPDAMPRVLSVVDRLENCIPGNDEASMYRRRVAEVTTAKGTREPAYAYFYNSSHPSLPPLETLHPVPSGIWSSPECPPKSSENRDLQAYRDWVRTYTDAERMT